MEQVPSLVEYGFRRAFITLIAIICSLLSVIGMSGAAVAFSDIRGNFGVSLDEVSWVITAYSLANIIIIPSSSWLSRQFGRRNYFAIAVMLFTVCSFFCGNATGIRELIIFRFLQGLGGGGMLVLSHTIITESWPLKKRATSQAFFILGMLAGAALAPPFGGYIVDNYSWPYIFFANIPVGIIVCLLILTCVRNGSYEKKEDWLDTMMLTIGTSSLYLVLARGQQEDWFNSLFIIFLSQVGLTGVILFAWRQLRSTSPGQTGFLWNVNLRAGLILSFIAAFGVAGSSIIMASSPGFGIELPVNPLWLTIRVLIVMLPAAAVLMEKGRIQKYVIATGMLLFAVYSYMLYRTASGDVSPVYMFWLIMIRSLAVALLSVSVSTLALSKLEGKQIGQGVALYNVMRQLGGAVGIALFSIYADRQAALRRMDVANQLKQISPGVKQRLSDLMAAKGVDSSMINDKAYALMHANALKPATAYSPDLFILFVGIVCLVCIPFVLYFVKNWTEKDDDR
ncbi:DHA2 family efflux MFS transporter permease subunit [Chitinophaga sp. CF418]|uniref:DHA2 family efflux MFS transporter permease subunit n=1 Tax=Chitinophaga sp. CF418 TaxID=1855287 RepID=UPI000923F4A9|nr:DHA2 family efflux MFS transporter permease subunit [Chitinophaga sp. CF418]SHN24172.1 MFS transporter, DHA2 family, multidrug resistance protein [Chitinophaga sp. CF418]